MSASRLVCFDLGGVLVRICRSWEEGCRAAGLDMDRPWSPADSGGAHHKIVGAYTIGELDDAAFFDSLESLAGGVYTAAEFRRIHDAWIIGEYPGAESVVRELADAGLSLACLSNTNAAHWRTMLEWPTLRYLHHRHASHEMGLAKPDPAIFAEFATRRAVEPGAILYFDDLPENVETADRAGWDAVLIDHAGDTAGQIRRAIAARGLI